MTSSTPTSPESAPGLVGAGLSVAAVARRLGVAPATLRTWDRRYGVGPSEHSAGSHRRYSPADVARLDLMRRLVNSGVPPSEAAAAAVKVDVSASPVDLVGGVAVPPPFRDGGVVPEESIPLTKPAPSGGGRGVVALPGRTPTERGLARAAMSLDNVACTAIVTESFARHGVVWSWDHLVAPVLAGVGRRWAASGKGIEVEHLLSESVIAALVAVHARLESPINSRPVLLACSALEMHSLPLFALSAALAERRIQTRVLGARVPAQSLHAAIKRSGPSAVVIWSSTPASGDPSSLAALPAMRPAPVVMAAGPGWSEILPEDVVRVNDLVDAVTRVANAV